jgi:LysM repeat protein
MSKARSPGAITGAAVLGSILLSVCSIPPAADVPYTIREGDTPASVAELLRMPLLDFLSQVGGLLVPGREIVVCPPGTQEPVFQSEYIEFHTVTRGETLLSICQTLGQALNMSVEELADFNDLPRRCHFTQTSETVATVTSRYESSLRPLADFYKTTPESLIRNWNELDEVQELPEARLLTVGWEEPREGDRLAYPLLAKLVEEVETDLKKEGLLKPEGAMFFNPKISYELYVFQEGDSLQKLAAQVSQSVASLRKANDLEEDEEPTVGQALFVPTAESAFGGSTRVYRAHANKGAVLRAGPSIQAKGLAVKQGQVLYVYERPYKYDPNWRAAMVDDDKKPWAWMQQSHLQFDPPEKRCLFYALGRAEPKQPSPPRPRVVAEPLLPVVMQVPNLPEVVSSPTKKKALKLSMVFYAKRVPYLMGTQSMNRTDCSGMVWYCLTHAGVWPGGTERTSAHYQSKRGQKVGALQPGDRVYFDTARLGYGVMDHTGIYVGGGKMVHATKPHVKMNPLKGYLKVAKAMRD